MPLIKWRPFANNLLLFLLCFLPCFILILPKPSRGETIAVPGEKEMLQEIDDLQRNAQRLDQENTALLADIGAQEIVLARLQRFQQIIQEIDGFRQQINHDFQSQISNNNHLPQDITTTELEQRFYKTLDIVLKEDEARNRILDNTRRLKGLQGTIRSVSDQLRLNKEQVVSLAAPPYPFVLRYGYHDILWEKYRKYCADNIPEVDRLLAIYTKPVSDPQIILDKRRDSLNQYFKQLGDAFVAKRKADWDQKLQQTPLVVSGALAARDTLYRLNTAYRSAYQERNYFKTIAILQSYEDVASVLAGLVVPKETNPAERQLIEAEINQQLKSARENLAVLQSKPYSYWMKTRLQQIKARISQNKLSCNTVCNKHLQSAAELIEGQRLTEPIAADNVYAILANHYLNLAAKGS